MNKFKIEQDLFQKERNSLSIGFVYGHQTTKVEVNVEDLKQLIDILEEALLATEFD